MQEEHVINETLTIVMYTVIIDRLVDQNFFKGTHILLRTIIYQVFKLIKNKNNKIGDVINID